MRSLLKPNESASLYAVSVDGPAESRQLAEKIASDNRGEVAFPLLSDPKSQTIDAYGLRDPAYAGKGTDGIPRPAVYVIAKSGRVAWAKIESDYKKRPTNGDIRAALDALNE
ncbi:MAG: redoxin domain-containing protein [Rubrivivax sp.]|nr:redoxin domain-containing protein [Pyrinomonadaceae bacterium]